MGVTRYWIDHRGHFLSLSRVDLRVMAIHASSTGSERHFSIVDRLVTADRNCSGDDTTADMTFLKSNFTDFTFEDFVTIVDGFENHICFVNH